MSFTTVSSASPDSLTTSRNRAAPCQVGLEQQIRHSENPVHRGSDFVAHIGEELAMAALFVKQKRTQDHCRRNAGNQNGHDGVAHRGKVLGRPELQHHAQARKNAQDRQMQIGEFPLRRVASAGEHKLQRKAQHGGQKRWAKGRFAEAFSMRPLKQSGCRGNRSCAERGLPAAERACQCEQHRLTADARAAIQVNRHEERQHRCGAEQYADGRAFEARGLSRQAGGEAAHGSVKDRRGGKHCDIQQKFDDRDLPEQIHWDPNRINFARCNARGGVSLRPSSHRKRYATDKTGSSSRTENYLRLAMSREPQSASSSEFAGEGDRDLPLDRNPRRLQNLRL
jgi:hypothetical protein